MSSAHSIEVTVKTKHHKIVDDDVLTCYFMNSGIDYDNWTREQLVQAEALAVEFLGQLVAMGKEIAETNAKKKPAARADR